MHDPTLPHRLRQQLALPLPGRQVQIRMSSAKHLAFFEENVQPPDPKVACVLLLLFSQNDQWHTVLIERSTNPNDRHSGQISFPGGRYEPTDGELVNVALREAQEEVGIKPQQVSILGRLTALYIPVSNFLVHPFVGMLDGQAVFTPQAGEVERILTPSLAHLAHPETRQNTDMMLLGKIPLPDVPYFAVEEKKVWGATAMILSEFLEVLASGGGTHSGTGINSLGGVYKDFFEKKPL